MKISYLMMGLGFSGGCMVIYDFLTELSKRGYNCEIVLPEGRLVFNQHTKKKILQNISNDRFYYELGILTRKEESIIKKVVKKTPLIKPIRAIKNYRKERLVDIVNDLKTVNTKIINNIAEDTNIVVASLWSTAYAAIFLSKNYLPLYHMQHYEELFYTDILDANEFTNKMLARSTYGLPINLIANSYWINKQIKDRFIRDSYILNPPIDLNIFNVNDFDWKEKYNKVNPLKIIAYADARKFKAFEDLKNIMIKTKTELKDKVEWTLFGGYNPGNIGIEYNFAGKVFNENLRDLYRSSHIVIMPSWYESFPLPPIEAMACGSLSICTRFGTEDFAIDGVNSFVFMPRDIEGMSNKIIELINKPDIMQEIVAEGIETSKNYSVEKRTDVYEKILEDVKVNNVVKKFDDIDNLLSGIF